MWGFVGKRIAATIPVMIVVALAVFLLLRLSPGDPAAIIAGDYATADQVTKIRAQLGLDQPIHVQFVRWMLQLLRGDLGVSIFSNLPVTTLIAQRIEPTLMLALTTIVFSVVVAVPLGVLAAWKAGTFVDRAEQNAVENTVGKLPTIYPKVTLGEAFGASALMQIICAVESLRRDPNGSILVPVIGLNQQAAAAIVSRSA